MPYKNISVIIFSSLLLTAITGANAQKKTEILVVKEIEEQEQVEVERGGGVRRQRVRRVIERMPGEHPDEMEREMRRRFMRERELEEMRRHDPDKYELIMQIEELEGISNELGEKYRQTEDSEVKEVLKDQLAGILDQLFDLKVELEELDQKRLAQEAKKLRERIEKRRKHKEEIIQLRLVDLLGKNEHLRW